LFKSQAISDGTIFKLSNYAIKNYYKLNRKIIHNNIKKMINFKSKFLLIKIE